MSTGNKPIEKCEMEKLHEEMVESLDGLVNCKVTSVKFGKSLPQIHAYGLTIEFDNGTILHVEGETGNEPITVETNVRKVIKI